MRPNSSHAHNISSELPLYMLFSASSLSAFYSGHATAYLTYTFWSSRTQNLYFIVFAKFASDVSILKALMRLKYIFWLIVVPLIYPLLLVKYLRVERSGLMELVFFWPLILVDFLLLAVLLWIGLELYQKNSICLLNSPIALTAAKCPEDGKQYKA